jgi:hypothetical protein
VRQIEAQPAADQLSLRLTLAVGLEVYRSEELRANTERPRRIGRSRRAAHDVRRTVWQNDYVPSGEPDRSNLTAQSATNVTGIRVSEIKA